MPSRKYAAHFPSKYSVTAFMTSSSFWKWVPPKCFFNGPNKKKSEGARSGLYGGCSNTSHLYFSSQALVFQAECGVALPCSSFTFVERNCPILLKQIFSFNFFNVSMYRSAFIVSFFVKNSISKIPCASQNTSCLIFNTFSTWIKFCTPNRYTFSRHYLWAINFGYFSMNFNRRNILKIKKPNDGADFFFCAT